MSENDDVTAIFRVRFNDCHPGAAPYILTDYDKLHKVVRGTYHEACKEALKMADVFIGNRIYILEPMGYYHRDMPI
jgi:hypothetical protein